MRFNAIYNVVWNRKRITLDPGATSLVQVEVLMVDRFKKYIGTGIYLSPGEFDQKTRQVVGTDLAGRYNKRIQDFINELRRYELSIVDSGRPMTSADLDLYFRKSAGDGSFVSFMIAEINKRTDIVVATRSRHLLVANLLKQSGIVQFSDLTVANIQDWDNLLRSSGLAQPTISKKHQVVKTYIHLAERIGVMEYGKSPYLKFPVPRGRHRIRTRLDDTEIDSMSNKSFTDPDIDLARDLYCFQIFTGISYRDLCSLTWAGNVRKNRMDFWIEGLRKKSGEFYSVFLVPEAVGLIKKYKGKNGDYVFPAPLIWTQNRRLKVLAAACGIDKNITSHTARHTAASAMVRSGVSLSVIRDVLGHTNVETTEIYARLEKQVIKKEMLRARRKRKFK